MYLVLCGWEGVKREGRKQKKKNLSKRQDKSSDLLVRKQHRFDYKQMCVDSCR